MMQDMTLSTCASSNYYTTTYYPVTVPYYHVTTTGEAPVSKHETAFKIIAALIDEGIIDGEKFAVKDLIALVTKLSQEVL
jgi:hypothetical protein